MHQATLGLRLKERGLDAVTETNLTWVENMRVWAMCKSQMDGEVNADDIRAYSRRMDWKPDSPNAFGAVFRGRNWKCIGRCKSAWPGNHGRSICIWKYCYIFLNICS